MNGSVLEYPRKRNGGNWHLVCWIALGVITKLRIDTAWRCNLNEIHQRRLSNGQARSDPPLGVQYRTTELTIASFPFQVGSTPVTPSLSQLQSSALTSSSTPPRPNPSEDFEFAQDGLHHRAYVVSPSTLKVESSIFSIVAEELRILARRRCLHKIALQGSRAYAWEASELSYPLTARADGIYRSNT